MQRKKLVLVIGIIAVCVIGALICVLLLAHKSPSALAPNGTGEEATTVPSGTKGYDPIGKYGLLVGQTGSVDKLDFTVTTITSGPSDANDKATTAVTFTIANKATTTQTVDPESWSAIDRSLGDVPQAAIAGAMQSKQSIPAGKTITQTIYFEGADIGRVVYSTDDANATQLTWRVK